MGPGLKDERQRGEEQASKKVDDSKDQRRSLFFMLVFIQAADTLPGDIGVEGRAVTLEHLEVDVWECY